MKILFSIIITIFLFIQAAVSQNAFDARSAGMAFSNSADTRGLAQIGMNPATLALPHDFNFEFSLLSGSVSFSNDGLNKRLYDKYFTTGQTLNSADKSSILSSVPNSGLGGNMGGRMRAFGIYMPYFSMAIGGMGNGSFNLPRDITELLFHGNKDFDRKYDFSQLSGTGWGGAAGMLSLGIPFRFDSRSNLDFLAVGATLKYIGGLAYMEITDSRGIIQNVGYDHSYIEIDGEVVTRTANGGSGLAGDFGLILRTKNNFTFSLTAINLFGSVNWTSETERRTFTVVSDQLVISSDGIDEDLVVDKDTTEVIGSFSTRLPMVLDLGVAYRVSEKLQVTASFEKGMSNQMGAIKKSRFALGTEYNGVPLLPLRTGISMGGVHGFSFAFGTGIDLKFWHLDLSIINHGGLTQNSARGFTLAGTTQLRF